MSIVTDIYEALGYNVILESNAVYKVVDLVGEGEIGGLVDGHKSVYLNDTPLQAANGTYNFNGVTIEERTGIPGQEPLSGFPEVETPYGVGATLKKSEGPVSRTITNPDVDAAIVSISLPALYIQDTDTGDMLYHSVTFSIQINGEAPVHKTISGKATSPYQRAYRIELTGPPPWVIKLERISDDYETNEYVQDSLTWDFYTEIIDHKFEYPDSALYGVTVDASLFGGNVPKRGYRVKGLKIALPYGYSPPYKDSLGIWQEATYPATWNGTFQSPQPSANPAWHTYNLLKNTRYGCGLSQADRWSLYPIAQYCDELVPDGKGGMEPRFRLNCVINTSQEAYKLLNTLVSVFRGMSWWGAGTVLASADMPADAQILASPANVIDGVFEYEGSALKARHTVAIVTWNNPDNNFLPEPEVVEDADGIRELGYRVIEPAPLGCTSQGQAHRVGKWILDSEKNETEVVTYRAGLDHAFVMPGMIVEVADPFYSNVELGGRILGINGLEVTLDADVVLASGHTYQLTCTLQDPDKEGTPKVEQRNITTTSDGVPRSVVHIDQEFTSPPASGAVWVLHGTDITPRPFRVLSKEETKEGFYQIVGLFHDRTKYARVEQNLHLDTPSYSIDIGNDPVDPPVNPTVTYNTFYTSEGVRQALTFSWEEPTDARVVAYQVQHKIGADGLWENVTPSTVQIPVYELINPRFGIHYFRVRSISRENTVAGPYSIWAEASPYSFLVQGMPDVTGLELVNKISDEQAAQFAGGDAKFQWTPTSLSETPVNGGTDTWFSSYKVEIVKDSVVVRTEYPVTPEYIYTFEKNKADGGASRSFSIRVYQVGNTGQLSVNPAVLVVSNPAPSMAGFIPDITPGFKALAISWAQMPGTDLDIYGYRVLVDETANPTTEVGFAHYPITGYTVHDLLVGKNYNVKIVPVDTFGDGTASAVAGGTPLVLSGVDIDVELTESISMTDYFGNTQDTLSRLYDRNSISNGVQYNVTGGDLWIQYKYNIETYFDKVIFHTANASARVYLGYSKDGVSWSYLKAEADHTLDQDGKMLAAADQAEARTNYLQTGAGLNVVVLPAKVTAKYFRLFFTGVGTGTTLYELVFVREVIAEQLVADNLSAISANLGAVEAGTLQSQNWGSLAGSFIDLNNDRIILGGSDNPSLYWDGGLGLLSISMNSIYDAGALATQDSVDYNDVSGTKPPADADSTQTALNNTLDTIEGGIIVRQSGANAPYAHLHAGDLDFWYFFESAYRKYKSINRLEPMPGLLHGQTVEIPGYWLQPPAVILMPTGADCYRKDYSGANQRLRLGAENIREASPGSGRYIFDVVAKIDASDNVVQGSKPAAVSVSQRVMSYYCYYTSMGTYCYPAFPNPFTNPIYSGQQCVNTRSTCKRITITAKLYNMIMTNVQGSGVICEEVYADIYIGGAWRRMYTHYGCSATLHWNDVSFTYTWDFPTAGLYNWCIRVGFYTSAPYSLELQDIEIYFQASLAVTNVVEELADATLAAGGEVTGFALGR